MTSIAERVAKGAQFLDEMDPEWWRADAGRAIDLDELDLGDGNACVLGQRCPLEVQKKGHLGETNYLLHAQALSGLVDETLGLDRWAASLGFQMTPGWVDDPEWEDDEFDALTAEWTRVIEQRRAAA